jgi:predicted secreted hydrolase
VTGEAWMDHEISSSQLSAGQVGWDWVSIQFSETRTELMLYRLRRSDGTADPASALQWVLPDGRTRKTPFAWEPLDTWRSPETGAVYPSRIRLTADDPETGRPRVFTIVPLLRSQEITGALAGIAYWEGACTVLDAEGRTVGEAYMELTGYARPLDIP